MLFPIPPFTKWKNVILVYKKENYSDLLLSKLPLTTWQKFEKSLRFRCQGEMEKISIHSFPAKNRSLILGGKILINEIFFQFK